ncbi:hypothetical protein FRB91_011042 [Serendipita sp. 411]|nr:hypothetical protein FRB91_011042 [Serendipita sp. 411]KAG9049701.1 hypothetical protein FS842_011487 [Serendipita sp. 407]
MHSIPKREDYIWLRVGAKALPTRAPVLECPSVLTDGQNSTYGRLDIEITIGDVSPMTISFTKPISTYRLFVKKGPKGLVKFYDLSSLVPKCDTLRVVHLGLEHCMPNPAIHHTPNMVGQLFNGLGTLSLSFGVKTTRDILYFHLTLPKLRTLFLKFSEVGLESYALDGWLLPSLNVFSFHTVIGPHDIGSQHTIPQFISIFISKYGPQLHGLRLMTDHRGFFDESGAVIPMEVDRMREFWEFFTNLTALSMDLKSLWEQIESSTVEAREIIRAVFSQLQYLAHVESSPLVSSVDGIQGALLLCGPKLETFTIVTYDGRTLGSSWLSSGRHSGLLERLIERCASVSVKFLDVHGRPLTMDMTPS